MLEKGEHARARAATVRARILGFGSAFDASAPRVGWGSGDAVLATALNRTLYRSGLVPRDIGRIVSGASGAVDGDRLEAHTLHRVFDDAGLPAVLVPKSITGQYGGGFLAAAVLAASADQFASPVDFLPDPELGVTPHPGGSLRAPSITLVTSLASGGAASWLLFESP